MVMGKGEVGKTTIAAALAVALTRRSFEVHLTTTDTAAHLLETLSNGAGKVLATLGNLRFGVNLNDADGDGHRTPAVNGDDSDDFDATRYPGRRQQRSPGSRRNRRVDAHPLHSACTASALRIMLARHDTARRWRPAA